ncbi:hypothetical protein KP79_PYT19529 [Mizuhopecten yessoensis]|uniref:Death domain-containing protein n=1 Tax=Mizuhopecten yessoensis TaxID=6573 RepID=A0A210R3A9_MIZYE|nr:hypothetical protein KP79_PYT19529 [Mizuhopecten yessoensis]
MNTRDEAPTDLTSSSTVTVDDAGAVVPSGSSAASQKERFPGQGISLGDGAQLPMEDWQFYFDTLSPNLSANLDDLAAYLDLPSDQLVSIRKGYNTEHERCFHVLWSWLQKSSVRNDTERLKHLRDALKAAGRNALAEEDIPTRNMYEYKGNVHDKEKKIQNGREALKIAKGVGDNSARLGRYFNLKEEDIARIVSNTHGDAVKQGQQIVEACINQNLLNTRQYLCDGLNYIGNILLINEMNEYWG